MLRGLARREMVKIAVSHLVQSNATVSFRAVSRVARVGFGSLKEDATLSTIIQEGNAKLKLKQEADIRKAVNALRERRIEVTVASVATYLGRSYRYFKKSPDLLGVILSATAQPKTVPKWIDP
jgi:ABC-type amino acid transport substrate-binding protein